METLKQDYLQAMGITRWVSKTPKACTAVDTQPQSISNWDELRAKVVACQACGLHKTRTQVVFGSGNQHAELLFVGEAPGANEDRQGLPFVGRAGQLLTAMLQAINLQREEVYIANILKCRPPNNRDPSPEEVALCTPFLEQQVALIKPKLIVALGRIAAHYLLKTSSSLSNLRGQRFTFGAENTPLIVTFHPAYLLRSPREKRKAYQDLLSISSFLSG